MLVFYQEVGMPFSKTDHIYAEIGLVLLLYGMVSWWLKANTASLIREEYQKSKCDHQMITRQSARPAAVVDELEVSLTINRSLRRPVFWYAGWSILAWLSAIWSYVVDKVQQFL